MKNTNYFVKYVDECIIEFVKLYGKDELQNVAKLHFQNTKKGAVTDKRY